MNEQRQVLTWLKQHRVPRRFRRYIGIAWTHISRIASKVSHLIRMRIRFATALLIGSIAALILQGCPIFGNLLAALGLSLAVVIGLVEELKAAMQH